MVDIEHLEKKVKQLNNLIRRSDQNQAKMQELIKQLLQKEEELIRHDN